MKATAITATPGGQPVRARLRDRPLIERTSWGGICSGALNSNNEGPLADLGHQRQVVRAFCLAMSATVGASEDAPAMRRRLVQSAASFHLIWTSTL
jgi:hypothetical protein